MTIKKHNNNCVCKKPSIKPKLYKVLYKFFEKKVYILFCPMTLINLIVWDVLKRLQTYI